MIFIDRSIPRPVAHALNLVRDDVRWLEDIYPGRSRVPDTEWLRDAGTNGWLVISRDKKIRTRPGERQAIQQHGVGCFILSQRQPLNRWGYLKLLARCLDDMQRTFARTTRPFVFAVDSQARFRRAA